MKKYNKRLSESIFLWTLFLGLVFYLLISLENTYDTNPERQRVEINMINSGSIDASIAIKDISLLRDTLPDAVVSFYSTMVSEYVSGNVIYPLEIVMTDESFSNFSDLSVVKGSFLHNYSCGNGSYVAVISDKLAEKVFLSYDVIGKKIRFGDHVYRIIGVYKEKPSIPCLLMSDGRYRIFIPFKSRSEYERAPIETVMVREDTLKESPLRIEKLKSIFGKELNLNLDGYKLIDYYFSSSKLKIPGSLIFLLSCCIVLISIVGYAVKLLKKWRYEFIKLLEEDYLLAAIGKHRLWLLKNAAVLTIIIICILIIINVGIEKIYFPPEILPPENIFAFGYYKDMFLNSIHAVNASYGYIPTTGELELSLYRKINAFFCLLFLVSGMTVITLMRIRAYHYVKSKYYFIQSLLPAIITVLIVIAAK